MYVAPVHDGLPWLVAGRTVGGSAFPKLTALDAFTSSMKMPTQPGLGSLSPLRMAQVADAVVVQENQVELKIPKVLERSEGIKHSAQNQNEDQEDPERRGHTPAG